MSKKPMLDKNYLLGIANSFRAELSRLHAAMDWSSYRESTIRLQLTYSQDKVEWFVACAPGDRYGGEIKGSDLGLVMDEVYHRLGYNDREEARIAQSARLLPAPIETDEEE